LVPWSLWRESSDQRHRRNLTQISFGTDWDVRRLMCPGLYGVGLFDFWSRRPSKEPCPCRSVIPRSSAARFSIQWPLAVPLPSRCRSGDQRSDDLRVAQAGAGRHRSATGPEPRRADRTKRGQQAHPGAREQGGDPEKARELLREPHDPKVDTRGVTTNGDHGHRPSARFDMFG